MRTVRKMFLFLSLLLLSFYPAFPVGLVDQSFEKAEVQRALQKLITKERAFLQRGLDNASMYLSIVETAFRCRGMPEELIYLPLIESGFSVKAYSRAGASGIWQFMPSTARLYHLRIDYWVDERRDPFKSTEKAADHLRDLFGWYGDWGLALAAYNAGSRAVDRAIEKGRTRDYWKLCAMGLLKRETREYVPRFCAAAHIAMNPGVFGFRFERDGEFPDFERLRTEKTIDLTILGSKSGVGFASLQLLNPELKKVITPFGEKYELRVPKESYARVLSVYRELPDDVFKNVKRHRVKTGETLGEIALKYNTDLYLLKKINNITSSRRLFAGDRILVPVSANTVAGEDNVFEDDGFEEVQKGFQTQEISYSVKQGDTIWSIAQRFDIEVERILAVNGLFFESIIKPGDEIELWLDLPLQP